MKPFIALCIFSVFAPLSSFAADCTLGIRVPIFYTIIEDNHLDEIKKIMEQKGYDVIKIEREKFNEMIHTPGPTYTLSTNAGVSFQCGETAPSYGHYKIAMKGPGMEILKSKSFKVQRSQKRKLTLYRAMAAIRSLPKCNQDSILNNPDERQ